MEGTIGEIRMFAGTFAPRDWSVCNGQQMSIRNFTALFAIVGTNYGGDGINTFNLPDLQGRTIVGAGQGPNLTAYNPGKVAGEESTGLNLSQMPAHIHNFTSTPTGTATVTIQASPDQNDAASPAGNLLGAPNGSGENMYGVPVAPVQELPMASGTLGIQGVTGPQLTSLTIQNAGSATPVHENRQPSLALNYLICLIGVFPQRN